MQSLRCIKPGSDPPTQVTRPTTKSFFFFFHHHQLPCSCRSCDGFLLRAGWPGPGLLSRPATHSTHAHCSTHISHITPLCVLQVYSYHSYRSNPRTWQPKIGFSRFSNTLGFCVLGLIQSSTVLYLGSYKVVGEVVEFNWWRTENQRFRKLENLIPVP